MVLLILRAALAGALLIWGVSVWLGAGADWLSAALGGSAFFAARAAHRRFPRLHPVPTLLVLGLLAVVFYDPVVVDQVWQDRWLRGLDLWLGLVPVPWLLGFALAAAAQAVVPVKHRKKVGYDT